MYKLAARLIIPRASLTLFASLFINVTAAVAQCESIITTDQFNRLTASTGGVANITWPDGVFPIGHPMNIHIKNTPAADRSLRYRAWVRLANDVSGPTPLNITAVSTDIQTGGTNIQLELSIEPSQSPWLTARTVILVTACESGAGNSEELHSFASLESSVSTWLLGVLATTAALIISVSVAIVGAQAVEKHSLDRRNERMWGLNGLFVDHRDKMSLSHFQIAVFSITVLLAVAYVFGRTRELSDLSEDVLFLLGISATGAISGRVSDVLKNRLDWENWAWLKFTVKAFPSDEQSPRPRWSQLVSTNGRFDLYRFQALTFTLLVAPAFAIKSVYSLGDANIPVGILAVLGLSQATYLFGKIAEPPTISDFNKRVSFMRQTFTDQERSVSDEEWERFKHEFTAAMQLPWSDVAIRPLSNGLAEDAEDIKVK
ncbi:hypothetical protein [uncultured Limimaricola sp.]|uniref:hypothetical protein n=1 Tax=uncultured Limimaricola sp. TaxID=2211667 RepID=UPI0030FC53BF